MKRHTFTLVELLTVIAIIVLLAGMLLPAIGKARATAMQTSCLNNISQLGKAEALFLVDNQQRIAPDYEGSDNDYEHYYSYCGSLYEYVGKDAKTFMCPEDDEDSSATTVSYGSQPGETFSLARFSYYVNQGVHKNSATKTEWHKISKLESPSKVLSLAEKKEEVEYRYNGVASSTALTVTAADPGYFGVKTHGEKNGNYLYMDGHAETLSRDDGISKLTNASVWKSMD